MDWVDRVREQANVMAQKAQDAQEVDPDKWADIQKTRRIKSLFEELGELVYKEEIRGSTEERQRAIAETIDEIKLLEDDLITVDLRDSTRQRSRSNA